MRYLLSLLFLVGLAQGADQKPLVINPTTGKTEQMQTGNNLVVPGTSTLTVAGVSTLTGGVRISDATNLNADVNSTYLSHNSSNTSAGNYLKNGFATQFWLNSFTGDHLLRAAASGTAGNAISWTEVLKWNTTAFTVQLTTSASASNVGAVVVGDGVAATSVAIGGGAIWAGGRVTSGTSTSISDEIRKIGGSATRQQFYAEASGVAGVFLSVNNSGGADNGVPNFACGVGSPQGFDFHIVTTGVSRIAITDTGLVSISDTTAASSSTVGAFTVGNGVAATSVAIGGGNINLGGTLAVSVAGGGVLIKEGTNATMGVATLVGGTVTVNTTKVTASSRIYLTSQVDGGTPGFQRVSARTAATSFTITSSSGTDTSTVAWMIVEPAP